MSQSERRRENMENDEAGRLNLPALRARRDGLVVENEQQMMRMVQETGGRVPVEISGLTMPQLAVMWKRLELLAERLLPDERDRLELDVLFHEWIAGFVSDGARERVAAEGRKQEIAAGVHHNTVLPNGLQVVNRD